MWALGPCLLGPLLLLSATHAFTNSSSKSVKRSRNNEIPVEPLDGLYLADLAKKVGANLRQICNEEMGLTIMQETFDNLQYGPPSTNDSSRVIMMARRLEMKLGRYTAVLNRSKAEIEEMFWHPKRYPASTAFPCCSPEPDTVEHGARSFSCILSEVNNLGQYYQTTNVTSSFLNDLVDYPSIKSSFFVSYSDLEGRSFKRVLDHSSPCLNVRRHRDIFFETMEAHSKKVLIVIDHGNSLSENQLSLAKVLSKRIIESLAPTDQVGLMALAGEVSLPRNLKCLSTSLPLAISFVKSLFVSFIDGLEKSNATTNHTLGFETALEIIKSVSSVTDNVLLVYLSRGLLSSLEEARVVMHTISNIAQFMPSFVTISAAALVDDGKPMMLEKHFMEDLTSANFMKYNLTVTRRILPGVLQIVNSTSSMSFAMADLLKSIKRPILLEPSYSLPTLDNQELVVSITLPCFHLNKVEGVVGLDLHLADLMEDVIYFTGLGSSYAFVITKTGLTVMHPSLPRPHFVIEKPMVVDIDNFETDPEFQKVRSNILNQHHNSSYIERRSNSRNYDRERVNYTWQHLDKAPYIIVIVSNDKGKPLRILQKVAMPSVQPNVVFHRLDLMLNPSRINICRHQRQLATLDAGSIYLSPACFLSPFAYSVNKDIPAHMAKKIMSFLFNEKGANPSLETSIKNDVGALTKVIDHWKNMMQESIYGKYIVRSFAATPSGIFQVYPGSVLDHIYDPTRRPWYTRALKFPGQVVLSTPYLDSGGAGYIITISHTVYEGQAAALHSPLDTVAAVLGLDVTIGFVYKMLLQIAPFCKEENVKCMLMDDEGYLLAHPTLTDVRGVRHHVTHKEPLVANDMLYHEGLATKLLCSNFADQTLQRYYSFNTSLDRVLTTLVHGEHCARYQITAVPGTNIFIGVVNTTCDSATTFCPCSVSDRRCLNCNRMEQTDCECPCDCSLDIDFCTGELKKKEMTCPPPVEPVRPAVPGVVDPRDTTLEPCFPRDCEFLTSYNDCLGVVGCVWCVMEEDETPLRSPFCTYNTKCFNGILGSITPYSDSSLGGQLSDASGRLRSTPVGPVASAFIGIVLIIVLIFACYKVASQRQQQHGFISSVPETAVRMSTLDNELDDEDPPSQADAGGQKQQQILLEEFPPELSPYRVNSNYRRPAGGDSDHGYSTMTPHDDSEHTPSAEPLLLAKPVRTSSNSSSPVTTELPPLRQFQAPVTVHMVDIL